MKKIMPAYKKQILYSVLGVIFHGITVVLPLLWYMGNGERSAGLALIVDFPLFLLANTIPSLSHLIYTSRIGAILYFSIVGTLMYFGIGWAVGSFLDKKTKASTGKQ
jgi:hypothetical protein